ncbi:MAG: hypothetical protein AB7J40_01125 [Candidatus Altimarinota bacterium]
MKHPNGKSAPIIYLSFNEHWIVLVRPVTEFFLSLIVFAFLWFSAGLLIDVAYVSPLMYLFSMAFLLIVLHRFFLSLISWELSNWVVTNRFIIDFQNNLLTKNDVLYIDISRIDEMEKKKHGVFSNLLRYGDVHINVAAAPYPIICKSVPYPGNLTNLIKAIRDHRVDDEIDVEVYRKIYGRKLRNFL